MIDFSTVKGITIPEGEVKKIEWNGIVLWKASAYEIISELLSYSDWGISSCEYVEDGYYGSHELEGWYDDDGTGDYRETCTLCGADTFDDDFEDTCYSNWIDNSYTTELTTKTLTLYNPENISETYQITYNPNESDINIPSSKVGWVFSGDSNRATTDWTELTPDGWYITTADSRITISEPYNEGGLVYEHYCTVTNVYKVELDNPPNGSDTPSLITFTIDEISYQAEEGMTWGEWVESDYNTGGFVFGGYSGNGITTPNGTSVQIEGDNSVSDVMSYEVIISNYAYVAENSSWNSWW